MTGGHAARGPGGTRGGGRATMAAMRFLLHSIVNAVAVWIATLIVSGFDVLGDADTVVNVLVFLAVGAALALVNAIVKPIVKTLSLPLYLLTLGLFGLVINALMLLLVGWLSEFTTYGLRVEDFWAALLGGLVVSIAALILGAIVRPNKKR